MKAGLIGIIFILAALQLAAQKNCVSHSYQQQQFTYDPTLQDRNNTVESFIRNQLIHANSLRIEGTETVIKIPVVV
ncbi:MAG TPA: hypothetical protein PK977_09390, partial [Chitinophagaceae bacterium]|nr:hypothetical protein [Chitinophagaceae bacterium]